MNGSLVQSTCSHGSVGFKTKCPCGDAPTVGGTSASVTIQVVVLNSRACPLGGAGAFNSWVNKLTPAMLVAVGTAGLGGATAAAACWTAATG